MKKSNIAPISKQHAKYDSTSQPEAGREWTTTAGAYLQNVFEVKGGFFLEKRTFVLYLCLENAKFLRLADGFHTVRSH